MVFNIARISLAIGGILSSLAAPHLELHAQPVGPGPSKHQARSDSPAQPMTRIRVSDDRTGFIDGKNARFVVWGVNYDHDGSGRLLDEYWQDEWQTVVEDFAEIKQLGANCVRIHLQFGIFMRSPTEADPAALAQLTKLLELAERTGLYLDLTGLACYHKQHIPAWYDQLDEKQRWQTQAKFWEAIAETCRHSPAVFCYDLMNEPILPGKTPETDWLTGELGGKFFVQRLALDAKGRDRKQIAADWVQRMCDAIRKHDSERLVTVGVIPWVFVFGKGKPTFYSERVGKPLDFVSIHVYPKRGEVDRAIESLQAYEVGKPIVIEEMFPLKCGIDELTEFVRRSADSVDGWISFYWGTPPQVLRKKSSPTMAEAITASWLEQFAELGESMRAPTQ
jgi:hypothetical protein